MRDRLNKERAPARPRTQTLLSQPREGPRARICTRTMEIRRVTRGHRVCLLWPRSCWRSLSTCSAVRVDTNPPTPLALLVLSVLIRHSLLSSLKRLWANRLMSCLTNNLAAVDYSRKYFSSIEYMVYSNSCGSSSSIVSNCDLCFQEVA